MNVKVSSSSDGNCTINLPNGSCFSVSENELPEKLRSGGEGIIMFFPRIFGNIHPNSPIELLNYLLNEEA